MENRFACLPTRQAKNISWSMVDGITCLPAGRAVGLAEWSMVIGKRPYPIN